MLLVLLGAADRAALVVAERALADELQRSGGFPARPEVDVAGVPFLTQALAGRYDRVDVEARDVPVGEVAGEPVELSRLTARLHGARVPLEAALSDSVTAVPVDRVDARVLLPFSVLRRRTDVGDLTAEPEGDRLRLRGTVEVLGRDLSASALSRLTVADGAVVVTAEGVDVGNRVANRLVSRAVRGRFDARIPLDGLPYGLQVRDVTVQPDGLAVTARATDTVLAPPAS